MQNQSWDDYRILLAVARGGSLLAAGRALGLATSTVSRRVDAWEESLGTPLLRRRAGGATLTEEGRAEVAIAERLEASLASGKRAIGAGKGALEGRVRVTAGEGFGDLLLDACTAFREAHPRVSFEILLDVRPLDLALGQADVALRTGRPKGGGLRARKIAEVSVGLFASRAYLARAGTPRSREDLARHTLIGFGGELARMSEARWLDDLSPGARPLAVNWVAGVVDAARRGLGIGAIAVVLGERAGLCRVLPREAPAPIPVWLVLHRDARRVKRVAAFADFLAFRTAEAMGAPEATRVDRT